MLRGANVGICVAAHQFTTIGQYAMIAANATVVKDVPPLAKFIPGKELGMNVYAVRKWNLPLRVGDARRTCRDEPFYQQLLDEWEAVRDPRRPVYGAEMVVADFSAGVARRGGRGMRLQGQTAIVTGASTQASAGRSPWSWPPTGPTSSSTIGPAASRPRRSFGRLSEQGGLACRTAPPT